MGPVFGAQCQDGLDGLGIEHWFVEEPGRFIDIDIVGVGSERWRHTRSVGDQNGFVGVKIDFRPGSTHDLKNRAIVARTGPPAQVMRMINFAGGFNLPLWMTERWVGVPLRKRPCFGGLLCMGDCGAHREDESKRRADQSLPETS